ncbi:MAG: potassium/proton antiporter, partial [Clostridia bacterium]|nr:potassium/proton antiporter [Clostridia bacterium]
QARPVAAKAIMLSTLGVVLTAGLTGVFCHFALKIGWLESFLIGSVIGSTDAASVFSILRSRNLNLRYHTASLREVESGSTDPCSYMLTAIFISAIAGAGEGNAFGYMIFSQIVYGLVFGVGIALLSSWLLRRITFTTDGFDTVFVVAVALLAYAAPAALGGNGYLSTYIVGIVLGNTKIPNKRNLVHFFDGITGLMQMLIFFLLGLLSFPSRLPQVALPALLIALFLTFVARPLAVMPILTPFRCPLRQQLLVSWAGLRGAASIVFAIMAVMAVDTENDIFHIVFFIVLFSILLQGSLIPFLSRKLDMLDEEGDVRKTFNDYSEEEPIQFIRFHIPEKHQWNHKLLREILLPPDTLVVLLRRNGENIVPNGRTKLAAGDELILSALSPDRIEGIHLSEIELDHDHELAGQPLSRLAETTSGLVIMIKRKGRIVIPKGDVTLLAGDILVLNTPEEEPANDRALLPAKKE